MITNEFDSGLLFNFEEESDIEISVLFPMNLSIDKIRGNVDSLEKNGLTNIVLLKSGELRSLILFNLTTEDRVRHFDFFYFLEYETKCYKL